MVDRAIRTVIIGGGLWTDAVVIRSTMATNANAASEVGGVRRWAVRGSERRVVDGGRHVGLDVVCRPIVVVAMDLIAVAGFEQVEEVMDEVVDLDDGIVAELRQRDVGRGVIVVVGRHGDASR
jgi:hypothetical protein